MARPAFVRAGTLAAPIRPPGWWRRRLREGAGGIPPKLARVSLHLFDTATRAMREFRPLEDGKVGIYICGLTTQGAPHIGHVRFAVAFDVRRRR